MKTLKNKYLREFHIYSSLFFCAFIFFFSITGVTLNHRATFESEPEYKLYEYTLNVINKENVDKLLSRHEIYLNKYEVEHLLKINELTLSSPGQRKDIYLQHNVLFIEISDFGVVSRLNDLHQGRYGSILWVIISDLTVLVLVLVSITGIWLSLRNNKLKRRYVCFLCSGLIIFFIFME